MEIAPFRFLQTPYGPAELNINQIYPVWDTAIMPQYPTPKIDPQVAKLLDAVIDKYGKIPTEDLNRRYSLHCPNISAGEDIPAREIFLYFSAAAYSDNYC